MIALAPEAIRARRRPSAVLFVFIAELAWALLVATPVHAWAGRAWGAHPDGDTVLFGGNGRDLMMWLGQEDAGLPVTVRTALVLLVVGAVAMQLPLGALIASLAFARTANLPAVAPGAAGAASPAANAPAARADGALRLVDALRVGMGAVLPLTALLALGTLMAIIVIVLGVLASSAVDHGLVASLGDARAFQLRLVTLALFGVVLAVIGVVVDLARVAVGREAGLVAARGAASPSAWSMMLRGVKTALTTSRRSLARATLAWAWRALLGLGLLAVGYAASQALGGRGGGALVGLFVLHQALVLGRVAVRASWLARALSLVTPAQDA